MRVGIAITRAANIQTGWTSAHIIQGLLQAGVSVRLIEPWDFEVDPKGKLVARAFALDPRDRPISREEICTLLQTRRTRRCFVEVTDLDLLLIRINPMDTSVLTWALRAQQAGVQVINPPQGLLLTSHKGWLASLADVPRPRTLVSRSRGTAHAFASDMPRGVVVKPARASGGKSIHRVRRGYPELLDQALDEVQKVGDRYVVIQEYLPEAKDGEKRLVWLDGQLLGGYRRERAPGEFRHNLKQGAIPHAITLQEEDYSIVRALNPHLLAAGIWLAGIDVIGGKVIEVNTLNPGGLHLAQSFADGQDLVAPVVSSLLGRMGPPSPDEVEQAADR
ncbi:MAG: hypothetical protein VX899_08680 [Myxococcota bacterium]|nr:hypothetical protein [Myxococcota bacterium]